MLVVQRIDGTYYVMDRESKRYYFEKYQDRWSAETTVSGLMDYWAARKCRDSDLRDLFHKTHHTSQFCNIEAAYIKKYGRDPVEERDERAREKGRNLRVDFVDGTPSLYVTQETLYLVGELYPNTAQSLKDIS